MRSRHDDQDFDAVLVGRLVAVRAVLDPRPESLPTPSSFDLLLELADLVRAGSESDAWLLVVGLTGAFPGPGVARSVHRALVLHGPEEAVMWLLDRATASAARDGNAGASLRIVTDRPVVDVNFTAKSDFLTGIQRVVRGVISQWDAHHDIELVAWTDRGGAYRELRRAERARLLETTTGAFDPRVRAPRDQVSEIVVPWRVPVVLTEVPLPDQSGRLAEIAQFTECTLRLVGYDCIPVSSAETVPLEEPEKFGRYLELVKFADRIAGISRTAAAEFEGYASALQAQGLVGPRVTACTLPHTAPIAALDDEEPTEGRPIVVCVGTIGRRKNQVVLVEAAELLWREGIDFELRIFGHLGAERNPLEGLVPELKALGRHLVVESGVSDARIAGTLARARCLVFPSLHEGFGLPIVEALSHGVPVITSDFGSLREVAEGWGGLLVDPEDVDAVTDALRALLTDDVLHARLVAQARSRPVRSWGQYADELWEALLG